MTFKELGLTDSLLAGIDSMGYKTATPVQSQVIQPILAGKDIIASAQTGTGKTAAFLLPIVNKIITEPHDENKINALIIVPTRELAIQIDESFGAYGKKTGLSHSVIFGGVSQVPQVSMLRRGVDILIATPGRLLDLMQQGYIKLNQLEIFVLDEADRMLDMGFIHDVKKVIAKLPAKRQTLFFSATMPPEIGQLANSILNNPVKVEITPVSSTAEKIEQSVYYVDKGNKKLLLAHLLQDAGIKTALVFTRTKHGADKVVKDLLKLGEKAAAIHGNKSQNARQKALTDFKTGALRILVATDIAARGIDVDQLSHVFNYELPNIAETYVHRIGRTGRAGASGIAISFCDGEEKAYLKDIQKLIAQSIPEVKEHPWVLTFAEEKASKQNSGSVKGGGGGFRDRRNGNNSGERRSFRGGDPRRHSTAPAGRSRRES